MLQNSLKSFVLLSLLTSQASTDVKRHYGGIAGAITVANTHTISDDRIADLSIKYGFMINRYLDIEAIGNFQLLDNMKIKHDYSYGLFLKPNYEIDDEITMYGLIGYSKNKLVKNEIGFKNRKTVQYDFAYGAGIEFKYENNKYLYVDFIRYIDKSTTKPEGKYAIKIDSMGIGIKYSF